MASTKKQRMLVKWETFKKLVQVVQQNSLVMICNKIIFELISLRLCQCVSVVSVSTSTLQSEELIGVRGNI